MVLHSGIAPISLFENDVFSHLKSRTCIHSNIYKSWHLCLRLYTAVVVVVTVLYFNN